LEELDRLLGFECANPVPGGTIDPRRLVNVDMVQVDLDEGSRIRGEDSGAVHGRDQEADVNLKAGDPTDLNVGGSEEDPRVRQRTRLRLSREDNMSVEGEDESILESSEDRDDQEEEGHQQVSQRDGFGTSLNPSESHHARNSFPPRQKRKYTRQPTISTLLEQKSSESQFLLQEVPASSQPKRKYTPRQSKVPSPLKMTHLIVSSQNRLQTQHPRELKGSTPGVRLKSPSRCD